MEIKYSLISTASHAAFDRDDFTSRMSAPKWGDRIPHVTEAERNGKVVEAWTVSGRMDRSERGLCNCIALMGERRYPTRWDEVPSCRGAREGAVEKRRDPLQAIGSGTKTFGGRAKP